MQGPPPHNLDYEQSVLGAMILSEEARLNYLGRLRRGDFYSTANQIIFAVLSGMQLAGKPVDLVTLVAELRGTDRLDVCGGPIRISALVDEVPLPSSHDHYIEVLTQKRAMRRLIVAAQQILTAAYASNGNAAEVLAEACGKVMAIGISNDSGELVHVGDLAGEAIEKLEAIQERLRSGKLTGIPYGLIDLDKLTGGMHRGEVTVLAGRPGMGKTALALNFAKHAAEHGYKVAIFSLEMERISMILRVLGIESRVGSDRFRNRSMDRDEWRVVTDAAVRMSELPIWIDDTPKMHYAELVSKLARARQQHGIDFFIIDYLGFLTGDSTQNRVYEVKEISRAIKSSAKRLSCSILLLSQLNRMVEQRPDKHPRMSDLRDSGDIEQDADNVMMLFRSAAYNKDPANPWRFTADIDLVKQRNGPTGRVNTIFLESTMTFSNQDSFHGECDAPPF